MAVKVIHVGVGGWGLDWEQNVVSNVPSIERVAAVGRRHHLDVTRRVVAARAGAIDDLQRQLAAPDGHRPQRNGEEREQEGRDGHGRC